jgi:hypothetical protein
VLSDQEIRMAIDTGMQWVPEQVRVDTGRAGGGWCLKDHGRATHYYTDRGQVRVRSTTPNGFR